MKRGISMKRRSDEKESSIRRHESVKMRRETEVARQMMSRRFHALEKDGPTPSVRRREMIVIVMTSMKDESNTATTQFGVMRSEESDGNPAASRMSRTISSISEVTSTADVMMTVTSSHQ